MAKKMNQPSATGFMELENKAIEVAEYKVPKSVKKKAEPVVEAVAEAVVETAPVVVVEETVVSEPSSEPTE